MKKLAIIGVFYDGYYDLWEDFLELKQKFWNNCKYPLYIVNQNKDIVFNVSYQVKILHAGADSEYSKKIQFAIENIDADYFLLLLDDFFFSETLEKDALDSILAFMEDNNIEYYSMPMFEFSEAYKRNDNFNGIDYLKKLDSNSEYTISCQPAIWKKEFLKKCIGSNNNFNAWVFEGIYAKAPKAHTDEFLNKCVIDVRNVLFLKHGALQGYMLPNTLNYYTKIGYTMKNNRAVLPCAKYYLHRLKQICCLFIPRKIRYFMRKQLNISVLEKHKELIDVFIRKLHLD